MERHRNYKLELQTAGNCANGLLMGCESKEYSLFMRHPHFVVGSRVCVSSFVTPFSHYVSLCGTL
jgi:hypothetical protein